MRRLVPLLAAFAALAAPALARAEPSITSVDIPVSGERSLASTAAKRFTLVGLHWQGPGSVRFRTRSLGGRWSAWRQAMPEAEDRPDRGSTEARGAGARTWRTGNPFWVGPSDRIEVRRAGSVTRLRAWLVWSPVTRGPLRTTQTANAPPIVPRLSWGADESIRRSTPQFASSIRLAVVHHTAGANGYSRAEAPAIVKAIQLYHVKGNGWNDIGYNFLVDRFGTVYEGRYGGVERNVVGAHAQGFNTGSVGVALLGTYGSATPPSKEAEEAIARVVSWRLDLAHVDPASTLQYLSNGSPRFPTGAPVLLRAVSGHRDTGLTACPGDALYARLPALAQRVTAIGLPKLYAPNVSGSAGGLVRFQARLSSALPWTVSVTDALGIEVAGTSGTGPTIDWVWDATLQAPGAYAWRIDAGASARPATGVLGSTVVTLPLALTGVATDVDTVSPNDDGRADTTTLSYTLSTAATVTVQALEAAGLPVVELLAPTRQAAGAKVVAVDASLLADGIYTLRITARDDTGAEVTNDVALTVSRTLGSVAAAPAAFSPNADGRADKLTVRFTLAAAAQVKLRILRDGRWVATPFEGTLQPGRRSLTWDGSKRVGRLLDGSYTAVVEATDPVTTSRIDVPFASDTRPPKLRFLPGLPVRLLVNEPATLTLRINGRPRTISVPAAGEHVVAPRGQVRVVAWDGAGNRSVPLRRP